MMGQPTKEQKGKVTSQAMADLGLKSHAPDSNNTLTTPLCFLCKLFVKIEFSKQRDNLIMRLELCRFNMAVKELTPFPALFTHESMDCQVWVYRTVICYLYTCFYIWSASDFPLDTVFECLWGKHQGFLQWLGFLKIYLFLYLFYMNWKFCQTHSDCMENMFQRQKTAKKTQTRQLHFYKAGEGEEKEASIITCWACSCLIWVVWETFCLLPS